MAPSFTARRSHAALRPPDARVTPEALVEVAHQLLVTLGVEVVDVRATARHHELGRGPPIGAQGANVDSAKLGRHSCFQFCARDKETKRGRFNRPPSL